jgi:hypothetical protein
MMQELKDKQEKSQVLLEEVSKLPRNINRCSSPSLPADSLLLSLEPCTPTASWTSSPPSVGLPPSPLPSPCDHQPPPLAAPPPAAKQNKDINKITADIRDVQKTINMSAPPRCLSHCD